MYFKRVLGYFYNYLAKKWPPCPLPQSSRGKGNGAPPLYPRLSGPQKDDSPKMNVCLLSIVRSVRNHLGLVEELPSYAQNVNKYFFYIYIIPLFNFERFFF